MHRLRWGALAWLLTLQFFVVETVVELRYGVPYSRADDVISALGGGDSPAAGLMNASFVLQALLIAGGVLLLQPALPRLSGRLAAGLLGAAAVGVLLVGLFPLDGDGSLHGIGAGLYLLGGGLGLLGLAYALRPRSEALGTALAFLGLVGTAATVFFVAGITDTLGVGGTERAAAYVLPIGLALTGLVLGRGAAPLAAGASDGPSRRERREQARAEATAQAVARDVALERHARGTPAAPDEAVEHSAEADDPWAPATPRRD